MLNCITTLKSLYFRTKNILGDFCLGTSRVQPRENVSSREAAAGGESTSTEGGKAEGGKAEERKAEGGKAEEGKAEGGKAKGEKAEGGSTYKEARKALLEIIPTSADVIRAMTWGRWGNIRCVRKSNRGSTSLRQRQKQEAKEIDKF